VAQFAFLSTYFKILTLFKPDMSDGTIRKDIQIGQLVEVVQKHHQRSGELTEGVVQRILTKSPNHPHGIKVMLEGGVVGRVKNVLD
jgi:uncharacterized repeat protein (TIGR03833 family)